MKIEWKIEIGNLTLKTLFSFVISNRRFVAIFRKHGISTD